ncbi:CRTAC1 family protein [Haloarchaeobius sp. TZWSO28]|uniref:CRTAC1 family protein n=1 Tax=Haloarchaeobius sp. TZWSO28 TaxID=3446119 RepID=UPI003EB75177
MRRERHLPGSEIGARDQPGRDTTARAGVVATALIGMAILVAAIGVGFVLLGGAATDASPPVETLGEGQFTDVAPEAGLTYQHSPGGQLTNGNASLYVTDYDLNGYPDILAFGGGAPVLYRNDGGTFSESGQLPEIDGYLKGALFFDQDNDGYDDLLLLRVDAVPVFLANRDGSFVRERPGFASANFTVPYGASAADFDADGCLDVFVYQNGDWRDRNPERSNLHYDGAPVRELSPVEDDNGAPNYLFRGSCGDGFERVTDAGLDLTHWTMAASFVDFTGDGLPDIHTANDFNNDVLYVNQGDGTFESHRIPDTNRHGMSSEVADVNGDGLLDVFVTNIQYREEVFTLSSMPAVSQKGNNLLINDGNGSFESREVEYGVEYARWGWASSFVDLDDDGDEDLIHTTRAHWPKESLQMVVTLPHVWERSGESFEMVNASTLGFERSRGRGMAVLDFDRDGDMDIAVADRKGPTKLYENRGTSNNALQVTVPSDGQVALGTIVEVTVDGETSWDLVSAKSDFLSQDTRLLHFGLGSVTTVDEVRVEFPDGTVRVFEDVEANQRLVVTPDGELEVVSLDGDGED